MLVNALIIHHPTSPRISLTSNAPAHVPPLEVSSDDDDDDELDGDHNEPSNTTSGDYDSAAWHGQLAKALLSMHHDMHAIITGFEECVDPNLVNNIQYKKTKYELMRIALMLNPSELPTCADRESTDLYTDLKELDHTVRREKHRSKILRITDKLRGGLEKLRTVLLSPTYRNQSLSYVQNFRKRMALCLADIHAYLIAQPIADETFNDGKDVEDELMTHKKTVSAAHAKMNARNRLIEQRLVDYRSKVKPNVSAKTHALITSPAVLISSKSFERSPSIRQTSIEAVTIATPEDFPDLHREANVFFDSESSMVTSVQAPADKQSQHA